MRWSLGVPLLKLYPMAYPGNHDGPGAMLQLCLGNCMPGEQLQAWEPLVLSPISITFFFLNIFILMNTKRICQQIYLSTAILKLKRIKGAENGPFIAY